MKNVEQLGKPLTKTEQKNILGGNTMTSGDLTCRVTLYSDWIVVATFGSNSECMAHISDYCDAIDTDPYTMCKCPGMNFPLMCGN